ncbi:UbiA prenyltransferase family-domain-containing protein [Gymnopilus junonius]|uniref:Protoheme IX farnesyltransferase, mitochondrial n=1 Tax=Gymnopilus junonius TaxID=109634 RepID=A0A9P5NR05_GYMJU|nr:UbiA prenyltransferase family-domain-containing protein [Gymnopilus junonius]
MHRNLSHSILFHHFTLLIPHATFTSFFFHNAQWTSPVNGGTASLRRTNGKGSTLDSDVRARILDLAYQPIPSTQLDAAAYKPIEKLTTGKLLKVYNQLAKSNLTILVVLTSMSGVALSPYPTTIPVLLATALGTVLCSASANTLNQLQEVPFDAQMARTRMRPFVRRAITPLHGAGFAIATGIAGPALLWAMTNTTTACLGLVNIVLYAGVYTWMKRKTIWNTWVGAIVGGIPPLMGWTATGGRLLPETWSLDAFPVVLPPFLQDPSLAHIPLTAATLDNPLAPFAFFMFLFSWQFFHFMPLSHLVRNSYAQAGYHMLSVFDPRKNALVGLRHTALLVPICSLLFPLSGLTTWWFALSSLPANVVCTRAAWNFWRNGGEKEARTLFQHSLWYLPVVMG